MRTELSAAALRDLVRLEEFLAERNPSASLQAVMEISGAIESLSHFPSRGARLSSRSKKRLVVPFGKASYLLDYALHGDVVLVLRIRHSREAR